MRDSLGYVMTVPHFPPLYRPQLAVTVCAALASLGEEGHVFCASLLIYLAGSILLEVLASYGGPFFLLLEARMWFSC